MRSPYHNFQKTKAVFVHSDVDMCLPQVEYPNRNGDL